MSRLAENSYGKSDVRLTKVVRNGERHDLHELTVRIMLGGAFERVYTDGDNSMCIPTDTMKNSVYALARTNTFDSPEAFAALLGAHFLEFDQVAWAEVDVLQERWSRITVKGSPHPHAFTREASGARTARVRADRGAAQKTWGGVRGLEVIKTTRSGFAGFYKDPLTTLPEVGDRIFATSVDAEWEHETTGPQQPSPPYTEVSEAALRALLETFATHDSASVQHTIYAMGEALLAGCPSVSSVSLSMPNQHRLLVNLAPLGMDNPNEIFVATHEPYGLINATVSRR